MTAYLKDYSESLEEPHVSKELIDYLEQIYPNRLDHVSPNMSQGNIGYLLGEVSVVRHLKTLWENQQTT